MSTQEFFPGELFISRGPGWVLYKCSKWDKGSVEKIEISRSKEIREISPEDIILSTGESRTDKYYNRWIQVIVSPGVKGWMLSQSVEKISEID